MKEYYFDMFFLMYQGSQITSDSWYVMFPYPENIKP